MFTFEVDLGGGFGGFSSFKVNGVHLEGGGRAWSGARVGADGADRFATVCGGSRTNGVSWPYGENWFGDPTRRAEEDYRWRDQSGQERSALDW